VVAAHKVHVQRTKHLQRNVIVDARIGHQTGRRAEGVARGLVAPNLALAVQHSTTEIAPPAGDTLVLCFCHAQW
jgi:hypothetical protein